MYMARTGQIYRTGAGCASAVLQDHFLQPFFAFTRFVKTEFRRERVARPCPVAALLARHEEHPVLLSNEEKRRASAFRPVEAWESVTLWS